MREVGLVAQLVDGALGHDDVIGPGQAVCPSWGELRAIPTTPELELLEVSGVG